MTGGLAVVALAMLLWRHARPRTPGAANIVLPALPARRLASRAHLAPVRHVTFAIFLAGFALFTVALADPHTALVQEEESYPGHRIAILIDASLSMNTAFATQRLAAGNTFLANVAAAEYFVRRRMEGPYHDSDVAGAVRQRGVHRHPVHHRLREHPAQHQPDRHPGGVPPLSPTTAPW